MGAELRVSMLLQANASQARAEVGAMRAEVAGLADAAVATGRAMGGASTEMASIGSAAATASAGVAELAAGEAEWGSLVQMTRAAIQPMVAEYYALGDAARMLAAAEEMGALSSQEAALAHDLLARQAIALTDRMQAAGVSIDGTTTAIGRHETAIQQLIAQSTGLSSATSETVADTLRHGQALDALRARFNPLFAASRQYELELREIAEAERLGAISAMEAAAARDRAAMAMAPAATQMQRFGGAMQQSGFFASQLGFQLNDIAMMVAAGQNPFILMMQQGTQVVQVFQMMRDQGVGMGAALTGTFAALLNPVNLLTMAVIGGGAALIQWLANTGDEAGSFEDAINEAGDAVARMQRLSRDLSEDGLESLRTKYGDVTAEVQKLIAAQDRQAERQARRALAQSTAEFNDLAEFSFIGRQFVTDSDENKISKLAYDLKATRAEATAVFTALQALSKAGSPAEQADAYAAVAAALEVVAIRTNDANGELEVMIGKALAAADNARQLAEQIASRSIDAAEQARKVAAAINSIQSRSVTISVSLKAAASGFGEAFSGWAQRTLDSMQSIAGVDSQITSSPIPRSAPQNVDFGLEGDGGGGGGGGGGGSKTDRVADYIKQLERERDMLREIDPVQRELLRQRELLADATEEQRTTIENLIAANQAEAAAMESLRSVSEMTGQALIDALMGGKDAAEQLVEALIRAGLQAALLGTGPLAGMFGTKESGGLMGMIFAPLMKAEGGRISGPGTSTSDSIPAWLSDGEYVVNAAATAANLPLLEMINNGGDIRDLFHVVTGSKLHAYAGGGFVGTGSALPAWGRTSGGAAAAGTSAEASRRPIVEIHNHSPEPIRTSQEDGPDAEGAVILTVGRATARGRFDGQNQARFGIQPKVTRR